MEMPILAFADGACSGNPGPGGWGAIIVLPEGHVTELGGGERATTNNRMELMGIIAALERLANTKGKVAVHTDSTYVIRGITQWCYAWARKGWKTAEGKDVANPELWKRLMAVTIKRKENGGIEWHFVKGHAGIPGNERCDEISVAFSQGRRPSLYDGPLLKYPVAIHDIPENTDLPEMKPRVEKVKAHSYLSLLGGTPMRHATWAECERRVKGQSGAKFKKATSEADEKSILASWGVKPGDLKK